MPLDKVRNILKIAKEPLSLETPIGDEEDSHLGDLSKTRTLPADRRRHPVEPARDHDTRAGFPHPARGARLRMRFGIGMNSDHTWRRWACSSR